MNMKQFLNLIFLKTFIQSKDLVLNIEISQRIFELCERKENVGKLGTYKLALLQALSLTTAQWLYHRRVIRVVPDMLQLKIFFCRPSFWG